MNFADAYDPIRALRTSWKLIARVPLTLLLGAVLVMLFHDGNGGVHVPLWTGDHRHMDWRPILIPLLMVFGCIGIACFLIGSWIYVGFALSVERATAVGAAEVGALFDSRGRFVDMVLARLLVCFLQVVAMLPWAALVLGAVLGHHLLHVHPFIVVSGSIMLAVLYLPLFLYIALGLSLFRPAVAIEGLGPMAAIQRSWHLAHGNRLRLLLYWIVLNVFTLLGFCLCCIGIFLTGSMARVAEIESYLALVKPDDYARSWLSTGIPPAASTAAAIVPPAAPPAAS